MNRPDKINNQNIPNWVVIYVKSRAEKKVAVTLGQMGIEVFLPLIKTVKIWSDRKKSIEIPLINGYLFLKLDKTDKQVVLSVKGVVGFVMLAKEMAIVRENEIQSIKQFIELGYQIEVGRIDGLHKKGDKVKITSGVLKGVEGYIREINSNKTIEVLLEGIGQSVRAVLPPEILKTV